MSNDLDKPLGLDVRKPAPSRGASGLAWFIGLALAVAMPAVWFSLQDMPYADPQVPEPEKQIAQAQPAAEAQPQPDDAGGPVQTGTSSIEEDEAALARTARENVSPSLPGGAKIIRVQPEDPATQGLAKISNPGELAQAHAVAHIPDPALIEDSPYGKLPKRGADGRRPMDVYARPWSGTRGAKVAILVGGMGISQTSTQKALDALPPDVTLGFAPQGNSLARWAQNARRKGHEILLQVPMEPFDYPRVDPGRGTLIVGADSAANLKVLHESMGRLSNYSGIVNYLGARFTSDQAAFDPVMEDIGQRGLLYLDDGTSARSLAPQLALKERAGFAAADLVIDTVQDENEILKNLDRLEAAARSKGSAIGVGTGFDVTIQAVARWVAEAKKRGIEIVGVSALATDPER